MEKKTLKHRVYRFDNTWKSQVRLKMATKTLSFFHQKMGALTKKGNILKLKVFYLETYDDNQAKKNQ